MTRKLTCPFALTGRGSHVLNQVPVKLCQVDAIVRLRPRESLRVLPPVTLSNSLTSRRAPTASHVERSSSARRIPFRTRSHPLLPRPENRRRIKDDRPPLVCSRLASSRLVESRLTCFHHLHHLLLFSSILSFPGPFLSVSLSLSRSLSASCLVFLH